MELINVYEELIELIDANLDENFQLKETFQKVDKEPNQFQIEVRSHRITPQTIFSINVRIGENPMIQYTENSEEKLSITESLEDWDEFDDFYENMRNHIKYTICFYKQALIMKLLFEKMQSLKYTGSLLFPKIEGDQEEKFENMKKLMRDYDLNDLMPNRL